MSIETNCPKHRLVQVTFESIWPDKHQYGEPIEDVYTYKCFACGSTMEIRIKNQIESAEVAQD